MATPTAQVSIVVTAPRAEVWEALTTPEMISQYFMGAEVETDWEVGSPITFTGEWQGKRFQDKGQVLTFEPQREVAYSHWSPLAGTDDTPDNYHVVDITLVDDAAGTMVTLTQSNLDGRVTDDDRAHREEFERNWTGMLEGMKQLVEA